MTRDDMIKMFTNMIDDAFQAGWDEGYRHGIEGEEV